MCYNFAMILLSFYYDVAMNLQGFYRNCYNLLLDCLLAPIGSSPKASPERPAESCPNSSP